MLNRKAFGCTIGGKHTYNDFGLICTEKSISSPEPQTKRVTVPSRNGTIDMSEVVSGRVTYADRTISLKFRTTKKVDDWSAFLSELQNYMQGQKMRIIFDDDLAFYYVGRTTVSMSTSGQVADISINATVDPYKYNITTSIDDWLWDPFDFEQGVINEMSNISVAGTKEVTLIATEKWENPIIISDTDGMQVTFDGTVYTLKKGSQVMYDILIQTGENTFTFTGNGTVSICYVGGML